MKKLAKLILILVLALTMTVTAAACRGGGGDPNNPGGPGGNTPGGGDTGITEEVDTARTQLYVSNFNGGYGDEWLKTLKTRFEEFYKDTEFEPGTGKKGVQVLIDNAKSGGEALSSSISGSRNEVFFSETVYYYSYVNNGLVADITDIVADTTLEEYGDEGTIEDKLNAQQKDFYRVKSASDTEGKYYGLPHYSGFSGIMYDVDLFDAQGFYFVADPDKDATANKLNTWYDNGNGGIMIGKNDTTPKSNGPDGEPGTFDDGLPATYDEFFILCDYIEGGGMTPVIWTGQHQKGYNNWQLQALATDYEGHEQMMLNFSFDGYAENLVQSIDGNGNVVKKPRTKIDSTNGYEMYTSAGRYYALKFFERLLSKSVYYDDKCYNTTQSHLMAQEDFLMSKPESGGGAGTIAMIMEGNWWENEAKDVFTMAVNAYGEEYGRNVRRIGYMPYPKATEAEVGDGITVMDTHYSLGFINANCEGVKLDLAKKFLKFAYTDESLAEFTVITNTPKALEYELEDADKEKMSYFGRSIWDIKENSSFVYPYSTNSVYLNHQSSFNFSDSFESKIGSTVYDNAGSILRPTVSNHKTAKEFFEGISANFNKTYWDTNFGN